MNPAAAADPAPQVRRRRHLGTIAKIVFGLAVLAFGTVYVVSRWSRMQVALRSASPGWMVLAAAFAIAGLLLAMVATRLALQVTSGRRLPVPAAARVFFVSQLGKYIPGSVWPIMAVTAMTGRYRIKPTESASAGLLAMFLSLLTGGSVGVLGLLASGAGGSGRFWWLLLALPVAALLGNARVVFASLNGLLRLLKRPALVRRPVGRAYGAAVGVSAVSWLFLGLQCWALCVALGADPAASLLGSVGGFALAYTAGTVFVPAPAGAGVREAVLGFALSGSGVLGSVGSGGTAAFTAGGVVAVVLLSRILLALLDFALAGVAVLVYARSESPARTAGPAGNT